MGDGTPYYDDMNPDDMNNQSSEDSLLDGIDPMAWLESLAARQGATEGFLTEHNMDIEEVDPNSVIIDEPGYTPYVTFGQDTSQVKAEATQPPEAPPEESFQQQYYIEQPPAQMPEASAADTYYGDYQAPQESYQQQGYYEEQPQASVGSEGEWGMPEGIDPMAWLESLAARQGATEGFTTEHNLDIAEIDPNSVVIDEPGYTPSESFRRPAQTPTEEPMPSAEMPESQAPLSAYETPAVESYESEYQTPPYAESYGQEQYYTEQQGYYEEQPRASVGSEGEWGMPEGIDPMAWLESLAARQGATEGFTTEHNLDIAEIDPNSVVIDEPGYTPSESFRRPAQTPTEEPMPSAEPVAESIEWVDTSAPDEDFMSALSSDLITRVDSAEVADISWLDDLAGTVDEEENVLQRPPQEPAADLAFLGSDLDASEDFAESGFDFQEMPPGIPEADLSFLSEELELSDEPAELEAIPATHTQDELVASIDGMSDEEIARAQAEGRLTGEQELAWLQRQAMSMHQARLEAEADLEALAEEDLQPAEAAEIPDWLRQSAVIKDEAEGDEEAGVFVDELAVPTEPEGIPEWLNDEVAPSLTATSEMELPDFTLEDADGTPQAVGEMPAPQMMGETLLHLDDYDPSRDDWAEALDEEHDRIIAGIEEDPTWFRTAMQKVADEGGTVQAPVKAPAEPEPIESVEPNWLANVSEEAPAAEIDDIPDDLPDWLRPVAMTAANAVETAYADDIETWLRAEMTGVPLQTGMLPPIPEESAAIETVVEDDFGLPAVEEETLEQAQAGAVPAWATVSEPVAAPPPVKPAPAREPVSPPPAPMRAPQPAPARPAPPRQHVVAAGEPAPPPVHPPAPVPANFAEYKAKLENNPQDHGTRLELARSLTNAGDIKSGLPQYETLIEQQGELDSVADDLRGLITTNPAHPALRRLLGDVYMRQGYLQEALDAYRGALDNL